MQSNMLATLGTIRRETWSLPSRSSETKRQKRNADQTLRNKKASKKLEEQEQSVKVKEFKLALPRGTAGFSSPPPLTPRRRGAILRTPLCAPLPAALLSSETLPSRFPPRAPLPAHASPPAHPASLLLHLASSLPCPEESSCSDAPCSSLSRAASRPALPARCCWRLPSINYHQPEDPAPGVNQHSWLTHLRP